MTDQITAGVVLYTADRERLAGFYERALAFERVETAPDHIVLVSNGYQLVLLESAEARAITSEQETSPSRRSTAAVKPVFVVGSIEVARLGAVATGGVINAKRHEWRFGPHRVCDGLDSDGNVIQLREVVDA